MVSQINNNSAPKSYTVKNVFDEAKNMLMEEMAGLKKAPLSPVEEQRMEKLAKLLSKTVLKEMDVI